MKNVELLAPAGNIESFYVAINNGADAVYLGLSDFNARSNIENFNLCELKEAIKHAHAFGVKVFLTLNILFSDNEIETVMQNVENLLQAGIDALIVQDLGVASVIRQMFPNAVLHASTQMGVCNLEGAEVLKRLGFSRVVLARETPICEIQRIHKNCDIEIEYFVQGALCVSYSGNCYISSLQSGASGNRGKCKQFCRLPYTLLDGQNKLEGFFLSAKDFCLLERLEELANAGVCSFKIEGRARRAGYVAQTVSVYRNAIDCLRNKQTFDLKVEKQKLKLAFNRGDFIAGYFEKQNKIDSKIQGHRGIKIGRVLDVNVGKKFNVVKIESSHQISRGDGLKFMLDEKELASVGVYDVKQISKKVFEITTTSKVKIGCDVNLTLDTKNEEKLLENTKKIDVSANFYAKTNKNAVLFLINKKSGVEICVQSESVCQPAQKQPLTFEEVQSQICKGEEIFKIALEKVEVEKVFLRKAELNDLRRKAIKKLKDALHENHIQKNGLQFEKQQKNLICKNENLPLQQIVLFSNIKQLENFTDKNTKLVYCPNEYSCEEIKNVCEKIQHFQLYLSLPIFATEADIKLFKKIFDDNQNLNIFANNLYAFCFKRKVIASQNMNVYNSFSVMALKDLGVQDVVVSIEQETALQNCGANLYCVENHFPVLMNFLHCPFQEHYASSCADCKFHEGILYQMQNGKKLSLTRIKAVTCNFELKSQQKISKPLENCGKAIYLF